MNLKITLLSFTFLMSLASNAQISLSSDDLVNTGTFYYGNDTTGGFDPGTPGANKTWDFSKLKKHTTSVSVISPVSIPGLDANYMLKEDGDTSAFFKKTSSAVYMIIDNGFTLSGAYQKIRMFNTPVTYNKSDKDSSFSREVVSGTDFGFPGVDSIRITSKMVFSTVADAWGSIKLASGTFNALRARTVIKFTMFMEGKIGALPYTKIPGFEIDETITQYAWYTNGKGYMIATYDATEDEMTWYIGANSISKTTMDPSLKVTNPFNDNLSIDNPQGKSYRISLSNLQGQTVLTREINGERNMVVPTAELPAGVYTLQIVNLSDNTFSYRKLLK